MKDFIYVAVIFFAAWAGVWCAARLSWQDAEAVYLIPILFWDWLTRKQR